MKAKRLPTWRELWMIPKVLLLLLSMLVPVMFLFSVIAVLDQAGTHRRLLEALQMYGRETQTVITSIDPESGRGYIFLSCPEESEEFDYVFVRGLSLYPSAWVKTLEPGQVLAVRYVAQEPHAYARQAVPLVFYAEMQNSPGITPDMWGLFGFFLVVAVLKPHFLFVGLIDLKTLLDDASPT